MKNDRAENYVFIGSIIASAALVALIFLPELNAIVLGITFAVLFQPLYTWFQRKMPGRDPVSALLVVLITAIIIFTPLVVLGFQLFGEASSFYSALSSGGNFPGVGYVSTKIGHGNPAFTTEINGYFQQFFGWIAGSLGGIFSGIATALFVVVIAFFALFYFLKDGERMHKIVVTHSPLSEDDTVRLLEKLRTIMESIVRGILLLAVVYGLAGGLGFFIFGLPNGILWGVITGFTSFIPLFGVYLIIIPGMLALALGHHYLAAAGLFIWIGVVGLFIENYLRPRLIGRRVNIHPLLILFSVIGGLSFFGPVGILLGPLALGLLLGLLEIYPVLSKVKAKE